jgi:hypothetical protein
MVHSFVYRILPRKELEGIYEDNGSQLLKNPRRIEL